MKRLPETQLKRRGHAFYPADELPALYATEKTKAEDKLIFAHYFIGACDWWIAEYDPDEGLAFGYTCLGDPQNAEWGYTSLVELEWLNIRGLFVVERELDWEPIPFANVNHPCEPGRRG